MQHKSVSVPLQTLNGGFAYSPVMSTQLLVLTNKDIDANEQREVMHEVQRRKVLVIHQEPEHEARQTFPELLETLAGTTMCRHHGRQEL